MSIKNYVKKKSSNAVIELHGSVDCSRMTCSESLHSRRWWYGEESHNYKKKETKTINDGTELEIGSNHISG